VRLLVCGSRTWTDWERVLAEIRALAPTSLIHGAARGADAFAAEAAASAGSSVNVVLPFPADWCAHGRSAGPLRNARMLAEGKPDRGLAFGAQWRLDAREDSSLGVVGARWKLTGTGDMVQRMLRAGLPVRWVATPDAAAVELTEMPAPGGAS
jgi:hypothetical protein